MGENDFKLRGKKEILLNVISLVMGYISLEKSAMDLRRESCAPLVLSKHRDLLHELKKKNGRLKGKTEADRGTL
jgi:hypothetical protein